MIPVFKPFIEQNEINKVAEALNMGWLGMGSYVRDFEEKIKDYLQAKNRYPVAVSTGHAALHLSLMLAKVGPGDEVITPAFNNIADFQAILATGARPVFCDINNDTLCIDLDKAEELVSTKTKAIIVMDYDCILCDHDRVEKFAKKYNIRVIHDAAHSFGSKYKGKMVGSFSDICMFSFDPVKTITCIDGGLIMVKSQEEVNALHEMRLIGMTQPSTTMYNNQRAWTYDVKRLGFRYHMSNPHAAIGLSQLSKMEKISKARRTICRYYNEKLKEIEIITTPKTNFEDITPFLYYIRVPRNMRDDLRKYLYNVGIDTGIHWQPGHFFTLFKNAKKGDLTVTNKIADEILSLPLHSNMTIETQDIIINAIASFSHLEVAQV
ncbi:MAG: DegT/DnrJ/EryC1/StrS aminotransferase family protein [Parachlamydiales bacterium]|nr:DegT/DnrJ/EryC1/StrS aminotransferase family protein [Parachlamydiales bacterium]